MIANSLKFMPYSKFISSSTKFFTSGTTTTQISNILTNTLGVVLGGIIDGIDNIFNPAFADFKERMKSFHHGLLNSSVIISINTFNCKMILN